MSKLLDRLGSTVGDLLLREHLVSAENIDILKASEHSLTGSFGENIVRLGLVKEEQLYHCLARHLNCPYYDPHKVQEDEEVLRLVSPETLRRHRAVPIRKQNNQLLVAMEDPADLFAQDALRDATRMRVVPALARPVDVERLLKLVDTGRRASLQAGPSRELLGSEEIPEQVLENPVIRFVDALLQRAISDGASDVHVDPLDKEFVVRYRIDGMLHDAMKVNKATIYDPAISRIKLLADIDIAERRLPQDGHFSIQYQKKKYDIRVATLPTLFGEKIVMRILDKSNLLLGLDKLGISSSMQADFRWAISRPHGLLLVTGPTGSGKTTTLYSIIHETFSLQKNFLTIEDPVEYIFQRINQVQVNTKAGLTFATALRHFLRQDPDIILVGEVRDYETAKMAVEAALTGHLVLTTLHTNNTVTAPIRLLEMGVEPFLIAASLIGVIGQRLPRRLCPKCAEEYSPDPRALERIKFPAVEGSRFLRGKGCDACRLTGYRGRMGIFEFLKGTAEVRELIARRCAADELQEAGRAKGMRLLVEDGFDKVQKGLTTIEEILRVTETVDEG